MAKMTNEASFRVNSNGNYLSTGLFKKAKKMAGKAAPPWLRMGLSRPTELGDDPSAVTLSRENLEFLGRTESRTTGRDPKRNPKSNPSKEDKESLALLCLEKYEGELKAAYSCINQHLLHCSVCKAHAAKYYPPTEPDK